MKPIAYMAAASIASWLGAAAIVGKGSSEIFFGMLGPLAAAIGTWLLVSWVHKDHPEQSTGLMAGAFAFKMVFFATYVTLMLNVLRLQVIPFMVSFTGYFIALYLMEALYLRRLLSERTR
jgi:hypothetical protein